MEKFRKMSGISNLGIKTIKSIKDPVVKVIKAEESPEVYSPIKIYLGESNIFGSIIPSPSNHRSQTSRANTERKEIFKDMKSIFKTCRGDKNSDRSCPQIKMNRQQKQALHLPKDLREFSKQHKLREKKVQIKYASTLKRIKQKGKQLGCEIRAKSEGIEFQLIKDKQKNVKDQFNYTFGKDFDRYFKKKLVKGAKKCKNDAAQLNLTVQNSCQDMVDSLKKDEGRQKYDKYNQKRMENYMIAKATQKRKSPFYVKTQLEYKIAVKNKKQMIRQPSLDDGSEICSVQFSSSRVSSPMKQMTKKNSTEQTASMMNTGKFTAGMKTSSSKQSKWKQYEEDIVQFLQICSFFAKVQHELLRYLPNNHISNKIQVLIDQVQHGEMITKIYKKCNVNVNYFDPQRIVAILKKCYDILSTMNYIANIIKLNISAERRKRVADTQQNIEKFQKLIKERSLDVCQKLKTTTDETLKKKIWNSLQDSRCQPLAINRAYTEFAHDNEHHEISMFHSVTNRNAICEILKYEKMMK